MKQVHIQIGHKVNRLDNTAYKIANPTTINKAMLGYQISQEKREKKEARDIEIANMLLRGRAVRTQQYKDLKRITALI